MEKEIWVFAEHRDEEIEEATLEVLSEARRLANKSKLKVSALILGHAAEPFVETLSRHGADNIYYVEHELLEQYTTDGYTMAMVELLRNRQPESLFLAATSLGKDLAPRVATRLNVGLVSDCRVLGSNKEGNLEMTRPTKGGKIYSKMKSPSRKPQLATITPGVLGVDKPRNRGRANTEKLEVEIKPEELRTRVLGTSKVDRRELDISEAEFVLAFGRGLGDESRIPQMEALADVMGACIAGSRVAVDEGWISFERQIGQTGKTITPKLILCCGISGAQQFTMGIRESRFITAINTDREAPIFKIADLPVLGDLNEIVPQLTEQLQKSLANR
ncbi:MAG: electron transfer flavoprotein subunit alpha/FixB family protein [Desulfobacteraceae bacterium]|nr:electron transfer flavoprotein subunit alpha/FixB family protein [Desulfobacteraceae bacterium]